MIGILNWYDEQPSWLAATTASMVQAGMRHIIGLDGAYLAFPGSIKQPRSAPEQAEAIREVCDAMGVGYTLHAPDSPWVDGECGKRSYGFRLADTLAGPDEWVLLMDADQIITMPGNLRELEYASEDVASVMFYERGSAHEANGAPGMFPVRCVFRSGIGLRVVGRHYDYVTEDGTNLWGDPPYGPCVTLSTEVEHRSSRRALARKQAQEAYYKRRDQLGLEQAHEPARPIERIGE